MVDNRGSIISPNDEAASIGEMQPCPSKFKIWQGGLIALALLVVVYLVTWWGLSIKKDTRQHKSTQDENVIHGDGRAELRLSRDKSVVRDLPLTFIEDVGTLKSDFLIYNDTNKTVHFVDVFHSCACTSAKLKEKELQPGQITELHLEADLHNRSGRQTFACQLVDKENKSYECMIRTELHERIEFVPATLQLRAYALKLLGFLVKPVRGNLDPNPLSIVWFRCCPFFRRA